MIKYYCKQHQRGIGMYNTEEDTFSVLEYSQTNIDWAYIIPEDGEFTCRNDNGETETKNVKKYDIVLQLYSRHYNKHDFLIIRSKEWKDNIKAKVEYDEKAKKAALEEDSCNCCECNCCDTCSKVEA